MTDADGGAEVRAEQIVHAQLLIDFPAARAEVPDADYRYLLGYLCMSYTEDQRYEEAIDVGRLAVQTAEQEAPRDDELLGHVRLNLGVAYCRNGDLVHGVPLYLQSWRHASRVGDERTRLNVARNVVAGLESGHPGDESAVSVLRECVGFFADRGLTSEAARAHGLLGEAELSAGHLNGAVAHLDQALEVSASLPGQRQLRRRMVSLLERAEAALDAADESGPPLGPGVRHEVLRLVEDGVENLSRDLTHVADLCFDRALRLLRRRQEDVEWALVAYLTILRRAGPARDVPDAAAHELRQITDRQLASAVRIGAAAADLDGLRQIAQACAALPSPVHTQRRGRGRPSPKRRRGGL